MKIFSILRAIIIPLIMIGPLLGALSRPGSGVARAGDDESPFQQQDLAPKDAPPADIEALIGQPCPMCVAPPPVQLKLTPQAGPAGTAFHATIGDPQVSLFSFKPGELVQLYLYGHDAACPPKECWFYKTSLHALTMDSQGSAGYDLWSRPDDPSGSYRLVAKSVASGRIAFAKFEMTPAPKPTGLANFYVDLGNPRSEAGYDLQNWADTPEWNPYISPSGDRTKRFLKLRRDGDASITFHPVDPGYSYHLIAEVEDGDCADDFQVLVAGASLYNYIADPTPGTFIRIHQFSIPGSLVTTTSLGVTFRNISQQECGHSGVYNIQLHRL